MAPTTRQPPPVADRIAARVVTGPLGHLAAGVADWAVLLGRFARMRAGRRLRALRGARRRR